MSKFTLVYFGLEGRAGPIRNMCAIGKVPYKEEIVTFEGWGKLKPTLTYGQVPVIRVGNLVINQSKEILRYVSKLAGLYPDDPLKALQVDALTVNMNEVFDNTIGKTMYSKMDAAEKAKVRMGFLDKKEGKLGQMFARLDLQIGVGTSGYLFEFGLTAADLSLFQLICHLSLGVLDGVPKSFIRDNFENLEKFRVTVASVEAIHNRFKDEKHRYHRSAYTVDWNIDDEEKKGE
jgi:glutathione S-transferase